MRTEGDEADKADYHGVSRHRYNRKKQTRKYIQQLQLIAAMGPPGGGRNVITDRLLTKFNHINMTFPTEKQITRIFKTMLNQQLAEFHAELKGICESGGSRIHFTVSHDEHRESPSSIDLQRTR